MPSDHGFTRPVGAFFHGVATGEGRVRALRRPGPTAFSARGVVLLAVLVLACRNGAASTGAPTGGTTTAPGPSGTWTLVWSDEFDGPGNSPIDTTKWLYDLGTGYPGASNHWGTGEIETMTNSIANVALDGGGHLMIRPVRDANGNWTSGRIETRRNDFQPPPSGALAVEASIQQPDVTPANGLGYWPAFWMLGGPFRDSYKNWPSVGEIDILENINGRQSLFGTFHCGATIPGPCNETIGIGSGERGCAGCLTAFHAYRVEWDRNVSPQQLRWYLDGSNYFTVTQNQVDAATWTAATNHGYMIILNVAMGGGFPSAFGGGPTATTASGVPMLVDYVRVYQR
jgi:beta-glucanase (GH16 family)